MDRIETAFKKVLKEGQEPSEEQLRLADFVAHGLGGAVVEARAGCAKSTTIEIMAYCVPEDKKVLIIAHNKHIAQELRDRIKGESGKENPNIEITTYHSKGFHIMCKALNKDPRNAHTDLDDDKYFKHFIEDMNGLSNGRYDTLKPAEKRNYRYNVRNLIGYARHNMAQTEKEIEKAMKKYGVEKIANEAEVVMKLLRWGITHMEKYDYQDMIWSPYELNIPLASKTYDYIFVDEAQDSSPLQQNIIKKCWGRSCRLFVFGDSWQTINSWCGSDREAFEHLIDEYNLKEFELSTSYRCSKKVIEMVHRHFPNINIQAAPWAKEGEIDFMVPTNSIREGDLVLCRNMSPLVRLYRQLLERGKVVTITGRDLGKSLCELINETEEEDMAMVLKKLEESLIVSWIKLAEEMHCPLKDVVGEDNIITLYDKIKAIETASQGFSAATEVKSFINSIFSDTDKDIAVSDKIRLATIHRAKGSESERVFILCPSLMPSKLAQKPWQKAEESNLEYVAYTRAKNHLAFVDEKEFPPFNGFTGSNEMYNELLAMKKSMGL